MARARKSEVTPLNVDVNAEVYAPYVSSGDLKIKTVEVTIDKDAAGNAIKVSAQTLVPMTSAGALAILADQAHLIRACRNYFGGQVAANVKAQNVPVSKTLRPVAEKLARLQGLDVETVLAALVAALPAKQ